MGIDRQRRQIDEPICVPGVLPLIVLTQVGLNVALGILLDTFVVRTLVIPALFALIGPVIWWPSGTDDRAPQPPLGPAPATAGRHRR